MGTRSIITFKSEEGILQVYKHWDGYTEHTIPELQKFLKWNGHRNDDLSYTMANYCYWHKMTNFNDQIEVYGDGKTNKEVNDFIKSGNTCQHTGLGILPNKVMNAKQGAKEYNAEFFYVVDLDQKTIDEEWTEKTWSFTNKRHLKKEVIP
tara:strand:+ start:408 stop:857 length:450 start_codon:yes stop_codon:yes gene_type:complete